MRVLVGCEFSGVVREAFRRRGHDAWSCDLLPAEDGSRYHLQGDVLRYLDGTQTPHGARWELAIFHPPCTHLASSGARWFAQKRTEQQSALNFVHYLWLAPIAKVAIENPIGILSSQDWIGRPTQIVQPWQFGHGETKATCLWLRNLPKLQPTEIVEGRHGRVWREPPHPDRWKRRSITYRGIAEAMAEQWGGV